MKKTAPKKPIVESLRRQAFAIAESLGYRGDDALEFIRRAAGVNMLGTLDLAGWSMLVKSLRGKTQSADKPTLVSEEQWRKVWALRRKLRLDEKHFRNLLKHITGLEHERFLDVPLCRALIAGLVKISAAEAKKVKA
jgi:hypothetical protein